MDTTLFIQVCKDEYGALFTMLRRVIELCPPELWDLSDDEPPFWQQAYHALWATDWFFGQNREKFPSPDFAEDERYDLAKRWETPLAKADILVYLDSIEAKGMALFDTLSAPALAAANPFSWTGPVVGNLMIYNLRHCIQHVGWLESYLSRRGKIALGWTFWNQEEQKYKFKDE